MNTYNTEQDDNNDNDASAICNMQLGNGWKYHSREDGMSSYSEDEHHHDELPGTSPQQRQCLS